MIAELTTEEIVTDLLSSHQILKREDGNFYISNIYNLGDFLNSIPKEPINDSVSEDKIKYTFIKNRWEI